jgi:hypothetical protein
MKILDIISKTPEVIVERTGKPHPHHDAVHQGFSRQRDPGGYYPSYHQYRTGMAISMADGSKKKLNVDHESWMGPYWTFHPYTDVEHDMIQQTKRSVPTEYDQVKPRTPSKEPNEIHRVSPVAAQKRNKYGI